MDPTTRQRPPLFVAQLPPDDVDHNRIQRVLIANRGEIACRIIATCRKLNITTIAVHVDEDAGSRHASEADETICLGSISQEGGNPFLNINYLVTIAVSAGADAIHPGYGFLSENSEFAEAVHKAGIIFIGPNSKAIKTLGDKRQSKEYLRKYAPSIPLVPGFAGSSQNVEDLEAAAEDIHYPVLLKASAGGGGRGMRIVRERAKLREELERAQSEAKRSFGSADCILEKYIESAKHIEVQIIGDSHGKVLSLWERECSVQRRHQKIIEETPSPFLTPEQRQKMCAAAVELGELMLYEGAGTVEFVVDVRDGSFYFLEVNTRLQVEHPITEEVTGLDIVALQLFVASGGRLSDISQLRNIPQHGHAIECRLCAEDPTNNFMPENGTIQLWREVTLAQGSRDVRYEVAVESGSNVSIYFDSMIAKIIVWAPTRNLAISRLVKVMANTACIGLKTNQIFLQSCLLHPAFKQPVYTTSLIPDNLESLLKNPHTANFPGGSSVLAVVPAFILRRNNQQRSSRPFHNVKKSFKNQSFDRIHANANIICPIGTGEPPFLCVWPQGKSTEEENANTITVLTLADLDINRRQCPETPTSMVDIVTRYAAVAGQLGQIGSESSNQYRVQLRKIQSTSQNTTDTALLEIAVNGSVIHAWVTTQITTSLGLSSKSTHQSVMCHFPALGTWIEYRCFNLLSYFEKLRDDTASTEAAAASKMIRAPMPCKVLSVLKEDGEEVKAGQTVLVIESMKMETRITSAFDGVFHTSLKNGDAVEDGKLLCWFD